MPLHLQTRTPNQLLIGLPQHNQWCREDRCRPGPTIKVLPFQPPKFAYNILNETKIMFHAYLKI